MPNATSKRDFKDSVYGELARIGKALSSPKRLELLDLLCQTDRTVEILARETAMTVANTSQHLQVLEAARVVQAKKQGRFVVYSVADALVSDFVRAFRVLAEDRLAEIEQLRRRFFEDDADLDPVDAETLIDRVKKGEVVAIDVRPIEEYKTAHIPGALALPLQELIFRKLPGVFSVLPTKGQGMFNRPMNEVHFPSRVGLPGAGIEPAQPRGWLFTSHPPIFCQKIAASPLAFAQPTLAGAG